MAQQMQDVNVLPSAILLVILFEKFQVCNVFQAADINVAVYLCA